MCGDYERWELFALVGFVICLKHLRLSPWLGLAALGLLGIVLSACLHGIACYSPQGIVDPYLQGGNPLLMLKAGWAIRGFSWFSVVAGLAATLIHLHRKVSALEKPAGTNIVPSADPLRP